MDGVHYYRTHNLGLVARLDAKIFLESAEDEALDPSTLWWVLSVGGKIAGFAGLKAGVEGAVQYGYLAKAGLLPEFRGKGLQKLLISVRDREAKKLSLSMNITYVAYWNLASANNLIACGYRLYDPDWKYGLKRALYFRKYL